MPVLFLFLWPISTRLLGSQIRRGPIAEGLQADELVFRNDVFDPNDPSTRFIRVVDDALVHVLSVEVGAEMMSLYVAIGVMPVRITSACGDVLADLKATTNTYA